MNCIKKSHQFGPNFAAFIWLGGSSAKNLDGTLPLYKAYYFS